MDHYLCAEVSTNPHWRRLELQSILRALSSALALAGHKRAVRMAMIARTTDNSISVKPLENAVRRDFPAAICVASNPLADESTGFMYFNLSILRVNASELVRNHLRFA